MNRAEVSDPAVNHRAISHGAKSVAGRSYRRLWQLVPTFSLAVLSITSVAADEPSEGRANRLAGETSPYLLQHARNPVDWYPWSDEALERAKRENKLIFLSIGYSSCHWCHVMEHESFENEQIAKYMNEHFVCIKVDREERPDVDAIYMLGVQLLTKRGGWPLSVFLTPDGRPFFGGTYFPAADGDRPGRLGFLTVCQRVLQAWSTNPQGVKKTAAKVAEIIAQEMRGQPSSKPPDKKLADKLLAHLTRTLDPLYGGFGFDENNSNIPKFPETPTLFFLLDQADRKQDAEAQRLLTKTLDRMAMGGLLDHVGGGFHRYSVDRYWAIPHFEKMLYDNGQLASVYAGMARLTGNAEYRRVVEELFEFIQRDMTSPEGAFYSALDADSEGVEGKYYHWLRSEWTQTLGPDDTGWLALVYTDRGQPNFEHKYIVPQLDANWPELAQRLNVTTAALHDRLDPLRAKLLAVRSRRVPPLTDKKILTAWNGLMIRGLADAGRHLDSPAYVDRAAKAAEFVLDRLLVDGRLRRTYTAGEARLNAYLDDYSFVVDGLLALHASTSDERWLNRAQQLTDQQIELFWDPVGGGFYFTSSDHEQLIVRGKLFRAGARPSGAAVAAGNLFYLARELGDPSYRKRAEQTVQSAAFILNRAPSASPRMVMVADWLADE